MTPDPSPLPGLATDDEIAAGRTLVRCGVCGRPLRGRDARLRGVGAGCRHKLDAGPTARRPGRFEVEQDTLPDT
jgi:hypothetical protein